MTHTVCHAPKQKSHVMISHLTISTSLSNDKNVIIIFIIKQLNSNFDKKKNLERNMLSQQIKPFITPKKGIDMVIKNKNYTHSLVTTK